MRGRFPWGLTVVCALAFVLLVSLGVWQVQRLQWKQGLIDRAEAAASLGPQAPAEVLGREDPEFRKIALTCPGLATAPYVELQTIHDGQAGVRLISACRHPGYARPLLVDRGFVAETVSARPPVSVSEAPIRLVAEVRETPAAGPMDVAASGRRFYARDNAAMAEVLEVGEAVAPQTFYALTSSNPEWAALQPSAPPAAFSNNHLGYAITWFGLAVALAGFYIALLRRKPSLKQPGSASEAIGKEEDS